MANKDTRRKSLFPLSRTARFSYPSAETTVPTISPTEDYAKVYEKLLANKETKNTKDTKSGNSTLPKVNALPIPLPPSPQPVGIRNYTPQGEPYVAYAGASPGTPSKFNFKPIKRKLPTTPPSTTTTETTVIPETPPKIYPPLPSAPPPSPPPPPPGTAPPIVVEPLKGSRAFYRHRFIYFPAGVYGPNLDMESYLWTHSDCILADKKCKDQCPVVPTYH